MINVGFKGEGKGILGPTGESQRNFRPNRWIMDDIYIPFLIVQKYYKSFFDDNIIYGGDWEL